MKQLILFCSEVFCHKLSSVIEHFVSYDCELNNRYILCSVFFILQTWLYVDCACEFNLCWASEENSSLILISERSKAQMWTVSEVGASNESRTVPSPNGSAGALWQWRLCVAMPLLPNRWTARNEIMTGWGKKKKGEGNEGEKEEDVKVGKREWDYGENGLRTWRQHRSTECWSTPLTGAERETSEVPVLHTFTGLRYMYSAVGCWDSLRALLTRLYFLGRSIKFPVHPESRVQVTPNS